MPAYMIITAKISDREAFITGYGAAAAKLVAHYGGRYVLRAPGAALLEGEDAGGPDFAGASVVISEWRDKAAALAFWNSQDYAEVRKLRDGIAEVQVLLVEAPLIGG